MRHIHNMPTAEELTQQALMYRRIIMLLMGRHTAGRAEFARDEIDQVVHHPPTLTLWRHDEAGHESLVLELMPYAPHHEGAGAMVDLDDDPGAELDLTPEAPEVPWWSEQAGRYATREGGPFSDYAQPVDGSWEARMAGAVERLDVPEMQRLVGLADMVRGRRWTT